MARVTVEDCVLKVPNRFDLVMKASQRARDISSGAELTLERDNDKNPVVALREIAEETVELDDLNEALIKNLQKVVELDEPGEDLMDFDMPTSEALAQAVMAEAPTTTTQTADNEAEDSTREGQAPRITFEDVEVSD